MPSETTELALSGVQYFGQPAKLPDNYIILRLITDRTDERSTGSQKPELEKEVRARPKQPAPSIKELQVQLQELWRLENKQLEEFRHRPQLAKEAVGKERGTLQPGDQDSQQDVSVQNPPICTDQNRSAFNVDRRSMVFEPTLKDRWILYGHVEQSEEVALSVPSIPSRERPNNASSGEVAEEADLRVTSPWQPDRGDLDQSPWQPDNGDLGQSPWQPDFGDLDQSPWQPDFGDLDQSPWQPDFGDLDQSPWQPDFGDLDQSPWQPDFGDLDQSPWQPDFGDLDQSPRQPDHGDLDQSPRQPDLGDLEPIRVPAIPSRERPLWFPFREDTEASLHYSQSQDKHYSHSQDKHYTHTRTASCSSKLKSKKQPAGPQRSSEEKKKKNRIFSSGSVAKWCEFGPPSPYFL